MCIRDRLVGLTNVSNLLLSFWLNTGTLEQHMGQLDDAAAQALAAAVAAPPHTCLLYTSFEGAGDAPLAQLVEQLTLNQWVPGSNP